ncbi:MAG: hypothetical protein V4629_06650 [Pseudomonadota bacterium]
MTNQANKALTIFSIDKDSVVSAIVATGKADYRFALEKLTPLVNRLEIQRRIQNPRFYDRLRKDILAGCLMPPITIAFIHPNPNSLFSLAAFQRFLDANISEGFVLDGIQRLSTLQRASQELALEAEFPFDQSIFINILVCESMDNLLYRMITLNNGQKPMSTRHQIEILSANLFDFSIEETDLLTEKSSKRIKPGVFSLSDFVLAYMAFLSHSVNIDSQKLIQEKLDDLVAGKILERNPKDGDLEYKDVIELVKKLSTSPNLDKWFRLSNNFIGFSSEIRNSYSFLKDLDITAFEESIEQFEISFKEFDVSKIKLGKARRIAVAHFIKNLESLTGRSSSVITDKLLDVIE